jgi:hypothetical protein
MGETRAVASLRSLSLRLGHSDRQNVPDLSNDWCEVALQKPPTKMPA